MSESLPLRNWEQNDLLNESETIEDNTLSDVTEAADNLTPESCESIERQFSFSVNLRSYSTKLQTLYYKDLPRN